VTTKGKGGSQSRSGSRIGDVTVVGGGGGEGSERVTQEVGGDGGEEVRCEGDHGGQGQG
jgi:hypothetical protein